MVKAMLIKIILFTSLSSLATTDEGKIVWREVLKNHYSVNENGKNVLRLHKVLKLKNKTNEKLLGVYFEAVGKGKIRVVVVPSDGGSKIKSTVIVNTSSKQLFGKSFDNLIFREGTKMRLVTVEGDIQIGKVAVTFPRVTTDADMGGNVPGGVCEDNQPNTDFLKGEFKAYTNPKCSGFPPVEMILTGKPEDRAKASKHCDDNYYHLPNYIESVNVNGECIRLVRSKYIMSVCNALGKGSLESLTNTYTLSVYSYNDEMGIDHPKDPLTKMTFKYSKNLEKDCDRFDKVIKEKGQVIRGIQVKSSDSIAPISDQEKVINVGEIWPEDTVLVKSLCEQVARTGEFKGPHE